MMWKDAPGASFHIIHKRKRAPQARASGHDGNQTLSEQQNSSALRGVCLSEKHLFDGEKLIVLGCTRYIVVHVLCELSAIYTVSCTAWTTFQKRYRMD
jgi:hypothetical protein